MKTTFINSNWVIAFLAAVNLLVFWYSVTRPFDRPNIQVECANELYIDHFWGNLRLFHYMQINNFGREKGTITSFKSLIVSKDNSSMNQGIKATYYLDKGSNNYYPFLNLTIGSNSIFESYIQFLKEPSKEHKDSISFYQDLRFDETEKLMKNEQYYDFRMKEVSAKTFLRMKGFINRSGLANLKEGTYNYIVSISTDYQKEPVFLKCYSFVIYPSDLNRLRENLNSYAKGGGNVDFSQRREQLKVTLSEIPITENMKRQIEQTN